MTCNVTGTAISPNGQIKPGAKITFRRAQLDVVSQEGSFVIPDDYIIQTALDGTVDFDILPGVYDATTVAVGGRTVAFRVSVPDEPAADFADLLNASYVEIPPASVTQAQQARDAAIAARDVAVAARDEALLYDGPKVDTFAELASVTPAQLAVGEYIRVIASGAVYQRVSTGGDLDYTGSGGVRLNVMPQNGVFRAADFGAATTHVEVNRAISAALARHNAGQFAAVELPAGEILMGAPMTVIDRPISVYGAGWRQTVLKFTTAGQCVTIRDTGFGPQDANDYPAGGDVAYNAPQNTRSGVSIRDLHITGDRTIAQDGIVFEGNCDNTRIENVMVTYVRGYGMFLGQLRGTVRGQVRESLFSGVLLRDCGDTGKAALYIYRSPTSGVNPSADSCNLNEFTDCQVIYPRGGHGVHIYAPKSSEFDATIYGINFKGLVLHSYTGGSGDLFRIEGNVSYISGDIYCPVQHQSGQAVVRQAANSTVSPFGIELHVAASNAQNVLALDAGFAYNYELVRPVAALSTISASTAISTGAVNVINDREYVELEGPVTLSGTTPVVLPMSGSTTNVAAFFGARTSQAVSLDGILGTVTVSGGDYTFTPDAPGATETINRHRAVLSKALVSRTIRARMSARWRGVNEDAIRPSLVDLDGAWLRKGDQLDIYTSEIGASDRKAYAHTKQSDQVVIGATNSSGAETDLLALRTNEATPRIDAVRSIRFTPQWNSAGKLQLGTAYLWRDLTMQNVLRFKVAAEPTTEQDGTPISMRVSVPASATAVGAPGWWAADASWFYVYTGDGTTHAWRRVAVAAW